MPGMRNNTAEKGNNYKLNLVGFTRLCGLTPAMQSGPTDHGWELEELVALVD
jgi:hypothetical protein